MANEELSDIGKGKDIQQKFAQLYNEIHKIIVGSEEVIENVIIALFSGGHVLLESVPGMGKTVLTNTIAQTLDCEFTRVQGTPDLTASDIVGTIEYDEGLKENVLKKGPVFTNMLLMDEINRAPPKTQSALLEAMAEKNVSLGGKTYHLPGPFMVIATQNPLDQEGTYPLPEAQMDRFLFKTVLEYLSEDEEILIMKSKKSELKVNRVFNPAEILIIKKEMDESIFIADAILDYVVKIVNETRERREVQTGASPRASIAFMIASKVKAFMDGRDHVIAADIKKIAHPILRHRIILYPEYSDSRVTTDDVIRKILLKIEEPVI